MINITTENAKELLEKKDELIVVDFFADWCKPCKIIGPIVDELSKEYKGKATIAKLDVDANKEIAAQYSIRNIPTILFIKNGEVIDKHMGPAPKSVLQSKINSHLN
jgi:thioredoxin 1